MVITEKSQLEKNLKEMSTKKILSKDVCFGSPGSPTIYYYSVSTFLHCSFYRRFTKDDLITALQTNCTLKMDILMDLFDLLSKTIIKCI